MRISNESNFYRLQEGNAGEGWCYSRDGKKIEIAKTSWEKMCYIGRKLLFSNGSNKTLTEAIVHTFSREDQAMIRAKLQDMKELKRVGKIARYASVAPEALEPISTDKLLAEIDKVPTDELDATHHAKPVLKEELQQLSKTFRVFSKIYKLAEELDQIRVNHVIENKIEKKQIDELVDLLKKISIMPYGYATPFQRKFYDEELQKSPILKVLKEHYDTANPMRIPNTNDADIDTQLAELHGFLDSVNTQTATLESHIEANPSDKMRILGKAFHTLCASEKKEHMKSALSKILPEREYVTKGETWAKAMTFACVSWASTLSLEDRNLFMDHLKEQLASGQMFYNLHQRFPPKK